MSAQTYIARAWSLQLFHGCRHAVQCTVRMRLGTSRLAFCFAGRAIYPVVDACFGTCLGPAGLTCSLHMATVWAVAVLIQECLLVAAALHQVYIILRALNHSPVLTLPRRGVSLGVATGRWLWLVACVNVALSYKAAVLAASSLMCNPTYQAAFPSRKSPVVWTPATVRRNESAPGLHTWLCSCPSCHGPQHVRMQLEPCK